MEIMAKRKYFEGKYDKDEIELTVVTEIRILFIYTSVAEIRNPLFGKTNTIDIPVIEKTIENGSNLINTIIG